MMKKTAVLIGMACLLASSAGANTITFTTPSGATESGGNPVDASATFVTGNNSVQITLTDLLNNPTTVAQLISDISFSLTSGQTAATINPLSLTTTWRTVNGNGTFSDSLVPPSPGANWAVDGTFAGGIHIGALLPGAIGPQGLIIGGPGPGGLYSNANGSIAGNGPHNPFLSGSVTFDLTVPGVNVDSSVNNVVFSFGTTAGDNVPAGGVADGGSTLMLLGAALSGAALIRRKLS